MAQDAWFVEHLSTSLPAPEANEIPENGRLSLNEDTKHDFIESPDPPPS
jgi:hypothetical protein